MAELDLNRQQGDESLYLHFINEEVRQKRRLHLLKENSWKQTELAIQQFRLVKH